MCSDDTIIATMSYRIDGTSKIVFRAYNSSNSYQQAQELFFEEAAYTLVATNNCETVILSPIYSSSTKIFILHRNTTGHFVMFSNHSGSTFTRRSCIHPDGDFFILTSKNGSDVWLRNGESGDYAYHSTVGSSLENYVSCAINREMIVLTDEKSSVSFSLYYPETEIEDPPEYGEKIGV